jgi:glycosyltransferase involved in cell wall biosynthesis
LATNNSLLLVGPPSSEKDSSERPGRLHYLCFQVTREGQASYAHVNGILGGLKARGWKTKLFEPSYQGGKQTSLLRKVFGCIRPQLKLWRSSRPDFLYYRSHPAALPTLLWARFHGIPAIGEVNGTFVDFPLVYPKLRFLAPFLRRITLWCFQLSSGLVTVTEPLANWLQTQAPKTKVYVVPNAADLETFKPEAESTPPVPEPYVVFVGAMSPWQGIDTLLEAVAQDRWPRGTKLLFIGDGTERAKVEAIAVQNSDVVYLGKKPQREIPGILVASVAGLSTQNLKRGANARYGFSAMKVFEIMACGKPVIVTDFPGQGDLVRAAEAGIVTAPEDAKAIADAVALLVAQPDLAQTLGRNGRKAIEQEHTWQHRADLTLTIIDRILAERRQCRDRRTPCSV